MSTTFENAPVAETAPAGANQNSLPPNPDPVLNAAVTPELVARHNLLPEEYEKIRQILGREATLTELGVFSVMWSEHCSYKNSRKLLRGFPTAKADAAAPGQVLVKAGEENAGVVDIGDGWAICFKIESHNHPSAVEPFEGAATGVGGIVRDIFTMGARPVLLTNSLRFGELSSPAARRLFRGVVSGISHYGNCLGIPNVGGDIYFDACYEGNPLVNALCLGVLKHDQIKRGAARGTGNPVYYVGAATGRDGLGGASFASRELSAASGADRPAVQKGDPFMEKLLLEACLEMMAVPGLVVGIQDMGAAGLTCSTCETAARGGSGIHIELDRVPQRETGMNSYEILLSESQERMLVIVHKGREGELEQIFRKWDLHAARIGEVTEGGEMLVTHHGVPVARIPAKALADDAPLYDREASEPAGLAETQAWTPAGAKLKDLDANGIRESLYQLLGHPTIAEKRWVWRQYDHLVQAGTAVLPGADAAVVRVRLGSGRERLLAISNDGNNRFCRLNPRRGGQIAIAECLRNLLCTGARPLGMTNNLNFGNPYKPESFYYLRECVQGLAEACRAFDVPVVGGNVSLYNESPAGAIDPTPTVAIAGVVDRLEELCLGGRLRPRIGRFLFPRRAPRLEDGRRPGAELGRGEEAAPIRARANAGRPRGRRPRCFGRRLARDHQRDALRRAENLWRGFELHRRRGRGQSRRPRFPARRPALRREPGAHRAGHQSRRGAEFLEIGGRRRCARGAPRRSAGRGNPQNRPARDGRLRQPHPHLAGDQTARNLDRCHSARDGDRLRRPGPSA
jgi:phosphoribosylformylglycinamidine synthase subunit PurL